MKAIDNLLEQELNWEPIPESERNFASDTYKEDECYLRMNNFPEEPLWTLFYKNESIDFDDTPNKWEIKYRSEI